MPNTASFRRTNPVRAPVAKQLLTPPASPRPREHLDACRLRGNAYANTASVLSAVFVFLHTHRLAARNPAIHLRVGRFHRSKAAGR